jgi:hypothetical protein
MKILLREITVSIVSYLHFRMSEFMCCSRNFPRGRGKQHETMAAKKITSLAPQL